MAVYTKELNRAKVLYEDHTLIAASASVNSGFMRLPARSVTITKKHTTGTYALTMEWSMDGTNTAFTVVPTMVDNVQQTFTALAPYLKVTIACTVTQFTVHQTTVMV
jgi:hypothetical protein